MSGDPPLVSCIMPTADRRTFVSAAVSHFLAQDYRRRELVVVDGGDDPVADLVPRDAAVRYHHSPVPAPLGELRNLACELSRGEIVVHWDDDDWMAPWRVSNQVAELLGSGADVCGLATVLYYDAEAGRAWRYTHPRGAWPWVAGATMAYRRSFWERNRFPAVTLGEDTCFLWSDQPKRVLALGDDSWYVASIHSGNTSLRRPVGDRWRAIPVEEVHARHNSASGPPAPGCARSRAAPVLGEA